MIYDIDRPLLADAVNTPLSHNTMPQCSMMFVHVYTLSQSSGCGRSLCIEATLIGGEGREGGKEGRRERREVGMREGGREGGGGR